MSKVCPKCSSFLRENTYFNKLNCDNCDYVESIKNNMWIEEFHGGNEIAKINEIIRVLNKITNPRVNEI